MIATAADAETATLINPTGHAYRDQVVRLPLPVPDSARTGDYRVKAGEKEIRCQLGRAEGKTWIWVPASLEPGERAQYVVEKRQPSKPRSLVSVQHEGNAYVLDNGRFAVRIPAAAGDGIPSPVQAVRVGGRWVGTGFWHTQRTLSKFTATVLGDGPLFAKVRLRYEFEGKVGLYNNVPTFAQVDITVFANQQHAFVDEAHEMDRGDYWEFDCAAGWKPIKVTCATHGRMPAHGGPEAPVPTSRSNTGARSCA